jgi:FlaA1/EpsC-like NDP-sugar epimerase
MIELSGRQPGRDIRIDITGIRPGERLHEELFNVDEQVRPTRYGKVMRATRPPLDPDRLRVGLSELQRRVADRDEQGLDDELWSTLGVGRGQPVDDEHRYLQEQSSTEADA